MRSIAPARQAKGLANLGSDPKNQLPPEGALRLRSGKAGPAAPAGETGVTGYLLPPVRSEPVEACPRESASPAAPAGGDRKPTFAASNPFVLSLSKDASEDGLAMNLVAAYAGNDWAGGLKRSQLR